jgi:hypothetical protein
VKIYPGGPSVQADPCCDTPLRGSNTARYE